MSIATRFAVVQAPSREGVLWSTTYTARRDELVNAGLVTRAQFPRLAKARSSSNGAHPESGLWYLWLEHPTEDRWSITYYSGGFIAELTQEEMRQLQRHLLNDLQITPETVGAAVLAWRARMQAGERPATPAEDTGE
ncbi:MAG: hypothetical protein HY749_13355 [Gammaproteobacteria bacterium]|nr:hypothetical protein [Gammaproteobacteria bacterium]MBI5616070.1 hypothetical protein [Gammaproteobacteria bacterium]